MIYGQWRRTMPRDVLDPYELRQRDEEEAWDLRNEALADRLDTWIGRVVRLLADGRFGPGYLRGARFRVVWRKKGYLIVASPVRVRRSDTPVLSVVEAEKFSLEEFPPARSPRGTMMDVVWASSVIETALNKVAPSASEEVLPSIINRTRTERGAK